MLLAGITVLEWTEDISGAFAARVLGSLGADVIKLEPPDGDRLRHAGPARPGSDGPSPLYAYLNHGKRIVTADPTTAEGAGTLRRLAGEADVLIETELGRGRAPSLDIAALRRDLPRLIVVSISDLGLGDATPATPLTLQHRAGYAFHEASPVTDPEAQRPVGCTENEGALAIGVAAANAAMCAWLDRDVSGKGRHLDLARFDFFASQLYPGPLGEYNDGRRAFVRKRDAFGGTEVAGGLVWIVQCADGWVIVSPREQHQWDRWMEVLDTPPWAADAELCGDRAIRKANFVRLQELMSDVTRQMTREQLFERCLAGHVACLPVNYPTDLPKTPQLVARAFFDSLAVPGAGPLRLPGLPFRIIAGGTELPRGLDLGVPSPVPQDQQLTRMDQ